MPSRPGNSDKDRIVCRAEIDGSLASPLRSNHTEIEEGLQQRLEQGLIPGGAGFFSNPDGSFDFSAAPGGDGN